MTARMADMSLTAHSKGSENPTLRHPFSIRISGAQSGMSTARFIDAIGHGPGENRIDSLRNIAATGSIPQAARNVGVS